MRTIRNIQEMLNCSKKAHLQRKTIGFVPTMGALHEGHLTLIRQARKENDICIVSIFVNPVQFGLKEDFKQYPRPIKNDLNLCRKQGVDFIFLPKTNQMYPEGFKTFVTVEELSNQLCGKFRSGHFRGVTTVVLKLFNILQPDIVYFGAKDIQQAIIIKKMVKDLNVPVKIKIMPIIRQHNGLALSSRNLYLSKEERKDALVLSQALGAARNLINTGVKDTQKILSLMRRLINTKRTAKIDYISIVDSDTLKSIKVVVDNCLIVLAVWIGKTRLIDNAEVSFPQFYV
ncbi:MAG: pantoate--beta-alanine ligase [Candidatus Omnitrophota bacterium]|nr:pantoate--beta-alanine ligase [Candidatus Omnitrophota bacterium]